MFNHIFLSAFNLPMLLAGITQPTAGTGMNAAKNQVTALNNTVQGFAGAVGAVLIAVAIMKYIMSIADESPQSKMNATLMLGGGIFFISMSGVLSVLSLNGNTIPSADTVAKHIVDILASLITYAGGGLLALGVFMYVMAISQENPDQQHKASTILGISTCMLAFASFKNSIKNFVTSGDGNSTVSLAIDCITGVATVVGGGILVLAVFKFVMGIREENSQDTHKAVLQFGVAIALLGFSGVLRLFGL